MSLWIGRSANEQGKFDGIVSVPYEMGDEVESQKPVSWYFVLDNSGSMLTVPPSKKQSRWKIASTLFEKIVNDLIESKRPDDTITIVVFNDEARVLCENVSVLDERVSKTIEQLHTIIPTGNTNIEVVTTILHTLMIKNPSLIKGTHRAAELFFTDGEATVGMQDAKRLAEQKFKLYRDLEKTLKMAAPFLWCGAISDMAKWQVVRGLSQASPISLWAYVRDSEIENFGREVGGVFASVTNFRVYKLDPTRTVMLLPDVDNLFYCESKPAMSFITEEKASSLITLFKVRQLIEDQNCGKRSIDMSTVNLCRERVDSREKTDDPFVNESVKWSTLFQSMKHSVLVDLNDMKVAFETTKTFDLPRQVSTTRAIYAISPAVAQSSDLYGSVMRRI